MDSLIPRKMAAEILGISTNALDLARKQQAISFIQYHPNGNVYFRERDLEDYISRNTHHALPNRGRNKKLR